VIVGDFLVFCWSFFGVFLVFFGNVVDGGFLGDFLDRISWESFVVISPALQKFPAREKKIAKKVYGEATGERKKRIKKKKKEEE
jgi:hypothetical protein